MSTYKNLEQSAQRLYNHSESLSVNVPKVIEKRIAMIAQQNPFNNVNELQEIERMVSEKSIAFFESWQNIALQSWFAQRQIGQMVINNWLKLALGQPVSFQQLFYQVNHETIKIFEKGLQPISRRVSANVRRLS